MIDWTEFINTTQKLPPRKLPIEALNHVATYEYALDFGAGGLRDTRYLLRFPFKCVDILDSSPAVELATTKLRKRHFNTYICDFSDFDYLENHYSIINAQFSLPFIKMKDRKVVVEKLKNSLVNNGVFVGNFFGVHDAWNDSKHKDISFYTKQEVEKLLSPLNILKIIEKEYKKRDPIDGQVGKWHLIEFIAIKK